MSASDAGPSVDALVLAGARASGDPLCEAEGVQSKAVIDIAGAPMLSYVMTALSDAGLNTPVWILGGQGEELALATGGVPHKDLEATGAGPAGSLAAALKSDVSLPVLVTTADHPLLTPDMVTNFLQQAQDSGADICIGFAQKATIEAAYPETRRTYLPIGERDLSGCNLFYLGNERAVSVLDFWKTVEQHRKHPWKIARRLGFGFLIRLYFGRAKSETVFALLSKRLGASIRPIILPFAEAAIDVDRPGDLVMVRRILERRKRKD